MTTFIVNKLKLPVQRDFLQYMLVLIIIAVFLFFIVDTFFIEDSFFLTNEELYKKYYYKSYNNNFQYLKIDSLEKNFIVPNARKDVILAAQNQFKIDAIKFLENELIKLNEKEELLNLLEKTLYNREKAIDDNLDLLVVVPLWYVLFEICSTYLIDAVLITPERESAFVFRNILGIVSFLFLESELSYSITNTFIQNELLSNIREALDVDDTSSNKAVITEYKLNLKIQKELILHDIKLIA